LSSESPGHRIIQLCTVLAILISKVPRSLHLVFWKQRSFLIFQIHHKPRKTYYARGDTYHSAIYYQLIQNQSQFLFLSNSEIMDQTCLATTHSKKRCWEVSLSLQKKTSIIIKSFTSTFYHIFSQISLLGQEP